MTDSKTFQTFMPLYCDDGERQCPGSTSDTCTFLRIKDLSHFENV